MISFEKAPVKIGRGEGENGRNDEGVIGRK